VLVGDPGVLLLLFLGEHLSLAKDVGLVVEVGEEEEHGPGVVERDGVEQPGVVTV